MAFGRRTDVHDWFWFCLIAAACYLASAVLWKYAVANSVRRGGRGLRTRVSRCRCHAGGRTSSTGSRAARSLSLWCLKLNWWSLPASRFGRRC